MHTLRALSALRVALRHRSVFMSFPECLRLAFRPVVLFVAMRTGMIALRATPCIALCGRSVAIRPRVSPTLRIVAPLCMLRLCRCGFRGRRKLLPSAKSGSWSATLLVVCVWDFSTLRDGFALVGSRGRLPSPAMIATDTHNLLRHAAPFAVAHSAQLLNVALSAFNLAIVTRYAGFGV